MLEVRKMRDYRRKNTIQSNYGRNLYVKHLEDHITEDMLRKEFEQYGKITSLRIMVDEKKQSKGFGFVCFSTEQEAQQALKGIGKTKILPGCLKPLYVNKHEPKDQRIQRIMNRGRNKNPNVPPPNVPYQGMVPPNFQMLNMNPYLRGYMGYGIPHQGMVPNPNPNPNPNQSKKQPQQQQQPNIAQNDEDSRKALGDKVMNLVMKYCPTLQINDVQKVTGMIIYSNYPVDYLNNMPEIEMKSVIDQAVDQI